MEVALRRRLEGVAEVSISQREQTAEVRFDGGDYQFSPDAFRKAIGEAEVVVESIEVDACGSIERVGDEQWLVAGKNRLRLGGGQPVAPNQPMCVSGRLDDRAQPPRLEVIDVRTAGK
jgi:hypothetical protein